MAESDNWVFDSLVGFLRGPVWNVPILTFIEHKSLVFEPEEDEQNEEEYKKIHDDYKNLVDFMLGSYMEDIGITPAQFEEACGKGTGKVKKQFHHGLFEQVWAADDFEIFKRMMLQKNIELQLQALELLQQRYGVLPESLQPEGKKTEDENESKVMEEVARISKEDHEAHVAALNQEEAELEEVLAHSLDEHKRLTAAKQNQEHLLAEHFSKVNIADPSGFGASDIASPVTFTSSEEVDPADLARRTAFLKLQRDKLLAMKRAEREKQLVIAESSQGKTRPKSARAARTALGTGGRKQIDPKTLEIRRALAEKLKKEVIGEGDD
eukprot:TRINITY_DN3994_c0_g1_i2.p1 TRINITY_DN3994_c0_g1~~TRINITY_DN3994_c0_g1_i2.p1  ORF type:complete len:337 (+),score=97.02 TRINITY_DN3994_c0_g1_i2:42-1013(+)